MSESNTTPASHWQSMLRFAMFTCCGILWTLTAIVVFQVGSATVFQTAFADSSQTVAAEDDGLRYTNLGWQDPSQWLAQPQQGSQMNLGSVSPLIWAAMLVLAVSIALMWLSNDGEVERIFQKRLEKAEMIAEWEAKKKS